MDIKRVFLIVLDSAGIGALPDAAEYGDAGSNTFKALYDGGALRAPNLASLGLFEINGMEYAKTNPGSSASEERPIGCFARLAEKSKGKDTTIGHWEIAGVVSEKPLPTYPEGFPDDLLAEFSRLTGRGVLCNKPYSGTDVIRDYGRLQKESGDLIVYTSADSVFQIAANEDWIPLEELYRYCEIARNLLQGEHGVGRVIARPFTGEYPNYVRTANRHDYSLAPPRATMCNLLSDAGLDMIGVGKINDIFAGSGITYSQRTKGNDDGMNQTMRLLDRAFHGLAFVNLVDFDMMYGHRNDVPGYTEAMNRFDDWLGGFLPKLLESDLLMITADHGCDPATPSTDHSREYVPLLVYGKGINSGVNLGDRDTFADIATTILDIFDLSGKTDGRSFKSELVLSNR
jgi:phosphopentomutase